MTELYELQFFLSCDAGEVVGRMLLMDRFKINQQKKFNSTITPISLSFQIWHVRC